MNIGPYTFAEFKERAAAFHGYPAPGLLLGGYMVAMAQRALPEGTLFEAVVESKKCLPDAVQLLTLCTTGNNWMKVINLGRYALSLFDKYSGKGFRVCINVDKLSAYPEILAWYLKTRPKQEQDTDQLFAELEEAGDCILDMEAIQIRSKFLGHAHMSKIGVCPMCKEAYPQEDGVLCRGCQGEAPYTPLCAGQTGFHEEEAPGKIVSVEEAVGKKALHDMTRVVPGESKGAAFSAGQAFTAGDVCRLQQMGRFTVAVEDDAVQDSEAIHENVGAEAFARRMAGANVAFPLPPKEGKINLYATSKGLLCVDKQRLFAFNMIPNVMCGSRQDGMVIEEGGEFAGTRAIPLYLEPDTFADALGALSSPIFSIAPLRKARVGILVTGTEVFQGLIEDKFIPVISAKVQTYDCTVVKAEIVPDDSAKIVASVDEMRKAGVDLLITTGGLSVDPGDITRAALEKAGLTDILYGAPVVPGAMSLLGRIPAPGTEFSSPVQAPGDVLPLWQPSDGAMQVIGVPACALYFKATLFDILLPRILAGRILTRPEIAGFAEGGFCMHCQVCTWPKCFFVK
jgi:Formylmethanofuran dehydrogenase subunit E